MSQVLDDIGIDIGIEEGCGTPCPQQPGTDFFWGNVKLNSIRQDQVDDSTQHGGRVLSCDMMGLRWGSRIITVLAQWSTQWCVAKLQISYPANHSAHWAYNIVPRHAMCESFPFDTIFLGGEREQNASVAIKLMDGHSCNWQGVTLRCNLMSCNLKSVLSLDLVCSPGCSMKKNPKHVMSAMHKLALLASGSLSKCVRSLVTTKSGVGLMRWAGGSFKNGTEKVAGAVGPDFLVGSVVGHQSLSWHIPAQCFA